MNMQIFYPVNPIEFSLIIALAILLDIVYPYHKSFTYYIHPTHTAYTLALTLYKRFPKTRLWGLAIWLIVVLTHILGYGALLYLANTVSRLLWIALSIYITKVSISLKLLINYVVKVKKCLENNDLSCARDTVKHIVRRNVDSLGQGHIASAAIESLFENLVDGFTSPIFFLLIIGPLGALAQRVINALDSALGYREPSFKDVGWFSAKADTYANFVPARLTALLTIALCPIVGGYIAKAWRIYIRDRGRTESKNAGHVMASAAGCLEIRLEKMGFYSIGFENPLPTPSDIRRGVILAITISILYIAAIMLLHFFLFNRVELVKP